MELPTKYDQLKLVISEILKFQRKKRLSDSYLKDKKIPSRQDIDFVGETSYGITSNLTEITLLAAGFAGLCQLNYEELEEYEKLLENIYINNYLTRR
jgi:hypothetical protein